MTASVEEWKRRYETARLAHEEARAEIERLQRQHKHDKLANQGLAVKYADAEAEIKRLRTDYGILKQDYDVLRDQFQTCRELREFDRAGKIILSNWLNTHHPHVAIAWERARRTIEVKP